MRDRALGLIAHLMCAVLDRIERATGVHDDDLEAINRATAEPTPIYQAVRSSIVRASAEERRNLYGDADLDEWDRELMHLDPEGDR